MFKKTKVCKGLLLAFGGSLALSAMPSFGQTAGTAQLDRVEITGSSIRRLAAEQSLPVTVLKTEDLARAGVTSAEQAINFVAANQSSTTTTNSVGASNGGAAYANLRGLGDTRTLVLVNGKRMVNNPYSAAAVDLNAIPFAAVDRIEVLTDGASAVYGTDAIAGVVNFIMKKEYTGVSLAADGSWPTASGGGQNYSFGITGGIGSLSEQGWNIYGGVSYRQQDALRAVDRDFAKTAYLPDKGINNLSGRTSPATYFQGDNAWNPSYPQCDPPGSINFGGGCFYDYVTQIDIVPKQEQLSLIARGSYAINKDNTIALEYLQANNKVPTTIAAASIPGMPMPTTSPFFPGGSGGTPANTDPLFDPTQPISVTWRLTGAGNRQSEFENDTNRILLNWEGQYAGWDYSANLFQSKATVTNSFTGGYVNADMIQNGIAGANGAPYINPFGPQDAAGAAYIESAQLRGEVQKATGTLKVFNAQTSGEIAKLPAGPMMLAVGVEFMKDENEYTNNYALTVPAASSGIAGAKDISGSRRDNAIMAELNIPVLKELELSLAIRYDDYSDFGGTTNPKVAFRYQPTQSLLFRGSYNEGFRAPTLQDIYAPNSVTYSGTSYDDAVLCPGGVVNTAAGGQRARDCNQQFQQQQGGNQNLKPETSKAWSLGFAVQPMDSLTLGLDYWNYEVSDSIGVTGENEIMGDQAKYSNLIIRCSQVSAAEKPTLDNCRNNTSGDPIAYFINTQLNLGTYKTSGIDITGTWQSAATDVGRFNIGYKGTYVLNYEYQLAQGGPYNNNLGVYFNGNPVARYRQLLQFGWQYSAWSAQLLNRYSSAYQDAYPNPDGSQAVVAGTNVWDLAVTWTGVKGLALTAGLTNMFNQTPPFSNQDSGFQVGYDQRYANPIGRAFLLRATYEF